MYPFDRVRAESITLMDALEYVISLRLTPSGELLTATEKLCLLILASGLDEAGEIVPKKDELAEACLINTRSLRRVLSELERKLTLLNIPQRTETGQDAPTKYAIIDAQGERVMRNILPAGRVLSMTGERVTRRREEVTDNRLASSNVSNNLQAPGSGMRLAVLPPPPNLNNGAGVFSSPALQKWAEMMRPYQIELTPEIANHILSKEPLNIPAWEDTLRGWLASGWAKTNVDGQLDRYYDKTLKRPEYAGIGNNPPPVKSANEQAEDEDLKRRIYGEDNLR